MTILEHDCARSIVHVSSNSGNEPGATVTGVAAAQKVYQSDGSFSLTMSVVDDRFRLNGSFTDYYETEMTGAHISMMVPELSAGVRLATFAGTTAWVEGGALTVKTNDPRGNTSISGGTIGVRAEHRISPDLLLEGTAERAFLEDSVTGWSGRVAVRYHHVEGAFRVLDLSVGPALFGPELGVGF